jgi:hypothetical protein
MAEPTTPDKQEDIMADDNKDLVFVDNSPVLDAKPGVLKTAGLAVIDITHTIPTTGKRKVTTKWEYWTYCAFCKSSSRVVWYMAS